MDANDRCDGCGAQAYYILRSLLTLKEIMLCNHHYTENAGALEAKRFYVIETSELSPA